MHTLMGEDRYVGDGKWRGIRATVRGNRATLRGDRATARANRALALRNGPKIGMLGMESGAVTAPLRAVTAHWPSEMG